MKISSLVSVAFFFALFGAGCRYDPNATTGTITVVKPAAKDTIIGATKNYQITWAGSNIATVKTIEISYDNAVTWNPITIVNADIYTYNWNVPDTDAAQTVIRITDKNGAVGKSGAFTIIMSGPGKTVAQKTGSTYTYKNTPIDTTGKLMTDSSYMTIDSVANGDTTVDVKPHAIHMTSRNLKTGLVTDSYINFESNGDISQYIAGSLFSALGINLPDWITFTVQSHVSSTNKIADDTLSFGQIPIHLVAFDTMRYVGSGTYTNTGINLPVFIMDRTTSYQGEIFVLPKPLPGIPFSTNAATSLEFAPSIGYYAKRRSEPVKIPLGIFQSGNGLESVLVSYSLK